MSNAYLSVSDSYRASITPPNSNCLTRPIPFNNCRVQTPMSFVSFSASIYSPQLVPISSSPFLRFAQGIRSLGANQVHARYTMDKNQRVGVHNQASLNLPNDGSGEKLCVSFSSPEESACKTDIGKQIFCNRSLNMKNIVAVGFDMDYTLAQYKPETFETLAYQGTIEKLVYDFGYPCEILNWSFDPDYMVRGLVLDKKRGNILKMDRHKYVKIAYHGFDELSKEYKVATYGNTLVSDSFDEPDYSVVDTLFSLSEAYLFAQLADFKDRHPAEFSESIDYARLYRDVKAAIDKCHRDGSLKKIVAKDLSRYINEDTSIVLMLKMLRDSGRATFLVTNSLWDYTNTVMNFLCGSSTEDGNINFGWLQYFDVVITGSAKPGFFLEKSHAKLFEVVPETGLLLNTDNGSPMPQVGDISTKILPKDKDHACKVFQGGSVAHLHKLLSIESSPQVLYVGDHIYGDILRSKKPLGWRTMLVVPELEKEVQLLWKNRDMGKELQSMRSKRDRIEDEIHCLKRAHKIKNLDDDAKEKLSLELEELELEKEKVRSDHKDTQRKFHQKFHKTWGQLMKTGYQNSRFAHQVERFACLYTSKVCNLGLHSPDKYYRPSEDFMPHEYGILACEQREMDV